MTISTFNFNISFVLLAPTLVKSDTLSTYTGHEESKVKNKINVNSEESLMLKEDNEDILTNGYSDNKETLEEDNISNTLDNCTTLWESKYLYSFYTSTPKTESDQCEECWDNSECVDCIVKHVLRQHESLRRILF